MTVIGLLALVAAGFGAGVVGYMTGLASIVSYPALLAAGLTPLSANVTNTVALVAVGVGSFAKSGRALTADDGGRSLLRSSLMALAGGIVGAALLLLAPAAAFGYVVPYLVALASVALLAQPGLRRWIEHGSDRPVAWPVAVFVVSIYGGYFGAGAGVIFLALALLLTSLPLWHSMLLKSALLGVANAVAAVAFIVFGPVHWPAAVAMGIGCLLGGWMGPSLVARLPARPLRIAIGLCGLGLAVWLGLRPAG
ncbi:sulfite exporter TauE/SafE family protein [Gordonia sp. PS3]|uniref:sulfite exporter TauE/SafE family protein n=1 Tax=Gordonia TaxID=2053 RepID=UPI0005EDEC92|nr:sulfite exporter TauE/SafE family protein [Gordonia sihwensis]KJR06272.1 transporter [Gordonia sihwensis]